MKKLLCIILCIGLLLLSGCRKTEDTITETPLPQGEYRTGAWVSFSELDGMLVRGLEDEFEALLKNCKKLEITDLFIHTRPFCDSYYPSELFPLRDSAANYSGDVLQYITEQCHKSGIAVHAWINPYRIKTGTEDIAELPDGSIAKKWLTDEVVENDKNICFSGGIYLNPASNEAQKLVIDGVREILEKYDVDGIHIDDYFYPTADYSFDELSFNEYCANTESPLSLSDWRRAQVNQLVSGLYTAVKFYDKDIIFSISPAASIDKNYDTYFADIELWMREGIADWIIPQLYFGFQYPDKNYRFDNLFERWSGIERADNVRLMIGLATYKIDTPNSPDNEEWQGNFEIISEQVAICRKKGMDGHIFFSVSSLFSENETNRKSLELLKKALV